MALSFQPNQMLPFVGDVVGRRTDLARRARETEKVKKRDQVGRIVASERRSRKCCSVPQDIVSYRVPCLFHGMLV
jgi:hypothetical protein